MQCRIVKWHKIIAIANGRVSFIAKQVPCRDEVEEKLAEKKKAWIGSARGRPANKLNISNQ